MLENNRKHSGVIDLKEKTFFAAVLIVMLLAALLWYNYLHRPILLSPQKVFEQAFVEPVEPASAMDGGNNLKFGFDYWIKFRYSEAVHLRKLQDFKPGVVEVARAWFAEKWPEDRALHDSAANYELLEHTDQNVGRVTHEWLLINKLRNYYCYRNWGV